MLKSYPGALSMVISDVSKKPTENLTRTQESRIWDEEFKSVLRIRIRWILKILASWIRIRKNVRIHGSGSLMQNINQKLQKKTFLLQKPKSELMKKEIL